MVPHQARMQLGRMNLPLQMLLAPYKLIIMNTHISFLGMLGNSVTLPFAIFQTLNNYGMAPSTYLWHGPSCCSLCGTSPQSDQLYHQSIWSRIKHLQRKENFQLHCKPPRRPAASVSQPASTSRLFEFLEIHLVIAISLSSRV